MPFLTRVLKEVLDQESKGHMFHLHVFCQGQCHPDLTPSATHHIHHLNNTVDRSFYRGFIISDNYRNFLPIIFAPGSCGDVACDYCVIVEDDVLFAHDAFEYFEKGMNLMARDRTVFAVSAYNDNSFPWVAYSGTFFRHISHFSGYGFVLSRVNFHQYLAKSWDDTIVWDHFFHVTMVTHNLVCIQPEVSRSSHASNPNQRHANDNISGGRLINRAQIVIDEVINGKNIDLSALTQDLYDDMVRSFIAHAVPIQNINDAGYFAKYADMDEPPTLLLVMNTILDIDHALRELTLVGRGLGGMIRGIYKGTLFIRPYNVLMLVMSRTSTFMTSYSDHVTSTHYQCDSDFPHKAVMSSSALPEEWKGAIYWLLTQTQLFHTSASCADACRLV